MKTPTPTNAFPIHPRWVLVCGGRTYANAEAVNAALSALVPRPSAVLTGGAPGADSLAARWAHAHNVRTIVVYADWKAHGRKAGPIRNRKLITLRPALVLAFPGGRGTANLVALAHANGLRVWQSPV